MPRVYTATGIAINFGGTTIPGGGGTYLRMDGTNNFIGLSSNDEMYIQASDNIFDIIAPGRNIQISSENTGTIHIYAGDSRLLINIGTASTAGLIIRNDQGAGTLMRLNGDTGNLDIKGALGTGVSF